MKDFNKDDRVSFGKDAEKKGILELIEFTLSGSGKFVNFHHFFQVGMMLSKEMVIIVQSGHIVRLERGMYC